MIDFEETFENWLEDIFKHNIPDNVKAFCFNLFEYANIKGVKFGINLIGSGEFDNDDWACDVIWQPIQQDLNIPAEYSDKNWQECLKRMRELIKKLLASNTNAATKLKSRQGIGIGFLMVIQKLFGKIKPLNWNKLGLDNEGYRVNRAKRI